MAFIKEAVKPFLVAAMAAVTAYLNDGCKPPGSADYERLYEAEIVQCAEKSATRAESCFCRLSVDEKYGLCDHPEWPRLGRCDVQCQSLK